MAKPETTRLSQLSAADLDRIHANLVRKYRDFDKGNIVGIAFGAKRTDGEIGAEPRLSVRFFVKYKRTPRDPERRIDDPITVRLRKGKPPRYVTYVFPTDVEEIGAIMATGVRTTGRRDIGTSGAVIKVREQAGNSATSFGWYVLTVGHLFDHDDDPNRAHVASRAPGGGTIAGKVVEFTRREDELDAAIVLVNHADAQQANLLKSALDIPVLTRGEGEIKDDARFDRSASIRRREDQGGKATFTLTDYAPTFTIGRLGPLKSIVIGNAGGRGIFAPGTSGAIWEVGGQIAAIQVGAEVKTHAVGYGQCYFAVDKWIRGHFSKKTLAVVSAF